MCVCKQPVFICRQGVFLSSASECTHSDSLQWLELLGEKPLAREVPTFSQLSNHGIWTSVQIIRGRNFCFLGPGFIFV